MENKKLVKILIKDMAELEELIAEIKTKQHFDSLAMEFIHTRAKGVLHMLQLLDASEELLVPKTGDGTAILEKLKDKVEKVSKLTADIEHKTGNTEEDKNENGEQPLPGVIPEPREDDDEPEQPQKEPLPGVVPEPPKKKEEDIAIVEETKIITPENTEEDDGEMLHDEPVHIEKGSRIGDSLLKNKSVNDLINEQVKLEYKLSNMPVNSIQSHIGINDRFQYTRELFGGDSKKYMEAVKTLDSMDNIKDAIDYLRANFKWKKNETSLKFVNLVKRRFQNSIA